MVVDTLRSVIFAAIYGGMENRLFLENGGKHWVLNHFSTYHVSMFSLFSVVAWSQNLLVWIFNVLLMALLEDTVWFLFEGRWHRRSDWSNWLPFYKGKPPLILKTFPWYWLVLTALLLLPIVTRLSHL